MSKKVVLSSTVKDKLSDLLEYLERGWSAKVKNDFIKKLDRSIARISLTLKAVLSSLKSEVCINA